MHCLDDKTREQREYLLAEVRREAPEYLAA